MSDIKDIQSPSTGTRTQIYDDGYKDGVADERERCVQAVCKASFTSGHVTDKGTIMLPEDKAIEAIKAE